MMFCVPKSIKVMTLVYNHHPRMTLSSILPRSRSLQSKNHNMSPRKILLLPSKPSCHPRFASPSKNPSRGSNEPRLWHVPPQSGRIDDCTIRLAPQPLKSLATNNSIKTTCKNCKPIQFTNPYCYNNNSTTLKKRNNSSVGGVAIRSTPKSISKRSLPSSNNNEKSKSKNNNNRHKHNNPNRLDHLIMSRLLLR